MKTLYYPNWETLEVSERPLPQLKPDEVLLKVAACGICGSELEGFKNRSPRRQPPLIMGHEFCGVIQDAGALVQRYQVGERVVSNSLVPCGLCIRCDRGDSHLCEHRQIFGMQRQGAFAEFVNVPERCLIDWPEQLPAEAACLAEPLANGIHIVNLTRSFNPDSIIIIGAGPIGLMCQQAIHVLLQRKAVVVDLNSERLEAARALGAGQVVNAKSTDVIQFAHELTNGEGVDLVVDAVGAKATKIQSLKACRPGGTAVWIGLHENEIAFDSYDITLGEKKIFGTYAAKISELQQAVELLASGKIKTESWIKKFSIDCADEAFHRMLAAKGDDIKAVVMP